MDKAKLVAENDSLEIAEFEISEPEFTRTNTSPFGAPKIHYYTAQTDGENLQHVGVLNAWGGAILRGEPMVADGREGIRGLTLSNAMHLSSWLGEAVSIPFDADRYHEELMKRVAVSHRKTNVREVLADTENTYSGTGEIQKRWNTNW